MPTPFQQKTVGAEWAVRFRRETMKNAMALDESPRMIEATPRVSEFMSLVKSLWKEEDSTEPRPEAKKKPLNNTVFNWPPCAC